AGAPAPDLLAGVRVPDADHPVDAARDDPLAVRRERRVPRPAALVPLRLRLPEPVLRPARYLPPHVGVDLQHRLAGVRLPGPHRAVEAGGHDPLAVAAVAHPGECGDVPFEPEEELPGWVSDEVPGGDVLAVRGHVQPVEEAVRALG